MEDAEVDVLAYMGFPAQHRAKLHSTNPLERLNGEIKRRSEVVGIFPNEAAVTRLIGALLLEQNDEWAVCQCRPKSPQKRRSKIPHFRRSGHGAGVAILGRPTASAWVGRRCWWGDNRLRPDVLGHEFGMLA